jgi:hypothetical protein
MRYVIQKSKVNLDGKGDYQTLERLSKKHGVSLSHIKKQYDMGLKVEMEHTKDKNAAHQIAIDHITENKNYYSKLKSSGLADELTKSISDSDKKKVDKFLKEYKGTMKDDDLHSFADSLGISPHKIEEYIYSIAMNKPIKKAIDYGKRLVAMMERRSYTDDKGNKIYDIDSKGNKVKNQRDVTLGELKKIANSPAEYDRNYKLQDRISWHGLDIAIENKKGSYRSGEDQNGKPWKTFMNYDYGRIGGTKGIDNEAVDCVSPETKILMADYTEKRADDIKIGDILIGSQEKPKGGKENKRKQEKTEVLSTAKGTSNMIRITLEDGSIISTTNGHLHSYFSGRDQKWKRADELKIGDILTKIYDSEELVIDESYMKGYLYGAYKGDGSVRLKAPEGKQVYCDIVKGIDGISTIIRVKEYLEVLGIDMPEIKVVKPSQTKSPIDEAGRIVISTKKIVKLNGRGKYKVEKIEEIINYSELDNKNWCKGFLAGFYDTDGCLHQGWGISISQVKDQYNSFKMIDKALNTINMKASRHRISPEIRISSNKWKGSDIAPLSFVMKTNPSTLYKRNFIGISLRFQKSKIVNIEEYNGGYIAIETDLGTYIANGYFTHNCYIGPDDTADMVYVVHQNDPLTGRYDEDKSMIGYVSKESAIEAYLSQYDRPDFLGDVSEFTIEEFKQSLKDNKGNSNYRSNNQYRAPKYVIRGR